MKSKLLSAFVLVLALLPMTASAGLKNNFESTYDNDLDDVYTDAIPEYHVVNDGLIRGGRPQKGDLAALKKQGVKTIINIDEVNSSAERAEAIKLGLNFIASPMSSFKSPKDSQVNKILAQLQDPALMPIFIHCKHGQDRTGMIMGLYRFHVNNWSSRKAYAEMNEYGFHPILKGLDSYFKKRTGYKRTTNNF